MFQDRHWDMLESRIRVVVEKKGSENRRGAIEFSKEQIPISEETEGSRDVRFQAEPTTTRQSLMKE